MKKSDHKARAFWAALIRGREAELAKLLQAGFPPNAPFPVGKASASHGIFHPLRAAASMNRLAAADLLLRHGADVEGGQRFLTPLLVATTAGHTEMAALLRKHGARSNFFVTAASGATKALAAALKKNPKHAILRDESGSTPLHYAACALRAEHVKLLLKHGADVNSADAQDRTPLMCASDLRFASGPAYATTIRLLLEHGANANARDWLGVTSLHRAVRARQPAAVKLLLEHGAAVDAEDKGRGSTPLRRAVTNTGAGGTAGKQDAALEIARLLLKHGADPRRKDARGRTVAQSARGREMVALLKEAAAIGAKRHGSKKKAAKA
ncbi:MAG: ankyrin repeat domain-containing protein [Planctomycetes bacterium]|nr:ankyrin repeat domain-containing protein [Planctomycetota bacterium]